MFGVALSKDVLRATVCVSSIFNSEGEGDEDSPHVLPTEFELGESERAEAVAA
jgi:hypothetical protein